MDAVNLSDRDQLTDLVERAEAGEDITILRDGKPVARIVPVPVKKAAETSKVIDLDALRALRATMTMSDVSGTDILREMRDSRY